MPNVVNLEGDVFVNCSSLEYLYFPKSLTTLSAGASIDGCTMLTSIEVSPDNMFFSSSEGVLYDKQQTKVIKCPEGKQSITLPQGLKTIGSYSFYFCKKLTTITIPESVTSIELCAFSECELLSTFYCKPITPPTLAEYALYGYDKSFAIYVPSESKEKYKNAWSNLATKIQEYTFDN